MIANSHATKKPFNATSAAIAASFPIRIPGESQRVTSASAKGRTAEENKNEFISRMLARHPTIDLRSILPTRFGYARDEPLRGQFTKCEPRHPEPANECAPAPRHLAAIYHARGAGVAREVCEPDVIFFRLQL